MGFIGLVLFCSGFLALMAWTGALVGADSFRSRHLAWLVEDVIVGTMGRGIGAALTVSIGIALAIAIAAASRRSVEPRSKPMRRREGSPANIDGEGRATRRGGFGRRTTAPAGDGADIALAQRGRRVGNGGEEQDFTNISMTNADDVAKLRSYRNPAFWHMMVILALPYTRDPHGFVHWVLQQSETDRATAGWIFLWLRGSLYLRGETIYPTERRTSDEVEYLLRAVCERSEGMGFANDALGLHENFEAERLKCLAAMEKGDLPAGILAPVALLTKPFGPQLIENQRFTSWDLALAHLSPRPLFEYDEKDLIELDITDAEDVAKIRSWREPALWHQAAMAALAYKGDPHDFLPWLIQQPEMDRATAGWIFFWSEGSLYLRGGTEFHFNSGVRNGVGLLRAICERSTGVGFSNDALGLDRDFEAERLKCLAVIENGELAPGIVAPMTLLSRPFDPPHPDDRFSVDDGMLICKEAASKG